MNNRETVRRICLATLALATLAMCQLSARPVQAQMGHSHHLYDYQMPPGEIAWRKSLMRHASTGYMQPVDLVVPDGAAVSVYAGGTFQESGGNDQIAGMMVGHIYRLKVTGIPRHTGRELFPSVEILGRVFPPSGQETRFPLPIHIPLDDLEPALDGHLVTRVIYLENPRNTLPDARTTRNQAFMDGGPGQDPIRMAEKFGRPMAIVRIGSRIPDQQELDGFGFGTPPIQWFQRPPADPVPANQTGAQSTATTHRPVAWQQQTTVPPASSAGQPGQWSSLGDTGPAPVAVQDQYLICPPTQTVDPGCLTCPAPPMGSWVMPANVLPWPDELLCDGGDRGLNVVARDDGESWELNGLDSEDTVGHFDTLDGRHLVDASNRVCIYAPRFSAIRKVDRLGHTEFAQGTSRVNEKLETAQARHRDFSTTTMQRMQPKRNRSTLQARGLEDMTRGVLVDNTTEIKLAASSFEAYEDLRLIKIGQFNNREKGRLAIAMQKANSWESNVSAQSTDHNLKLFVVDDIASVRETIHVKTEKGRPQLRLVKVASADTALPGDEIEFTIRFDNVGNESIGNVTIMDNLTTRLEYIPDSAECSLPGQFVATPNNSGSQTLSWEITDPLKVNDGGIIRFRCRVR